MNINFIHYLLAVATLLIGNLVSAQMVKKPSLPSSNAPSTEEVTDSLPNNSGDTLRLPIANAAGFDVPISYNAKDSIVYDITNEKIYLYGTAKVEQGKILLTANEIKIDNTNKLMTAQPTLDSLGKARGTPHFTEGEHQFEADQITYNFETKKGKIQQLVTKEGEGYLVGEKVKKNAENDMFIKDASYTTCDLDHPHFKIAVDKVKVVPDKLIVSGPAQLIIEDVPTPLVLPFGIFPVQKSQTSGLIFPSYGYSPQRGYNFQGLGYYFGGGEKFDISFTTDIFTNGTWGLHNDIRYKKRYKYGGNISLNYMNERDNDYISTKFQILRRFAIRWNHSQDAKARPYSKFSADVNVGSTDYNRSYLVSNNNVLTNTLQSAVTYSKTIPYSLFSYTIQARQNQNTNTRIIDLTLPNFNLSMSRWLPFKRKEQIGKLRWYEQIGMTYSLDAQARASIPDSLFFSQKLIDTLQYGMRHQANLNANVNLLKYFTFTPTLSFTDAIYTKTIRKTWDTLLVQTLAASGEYVTDTVEKEVSYFENGLAQNIRINGGVSLGTKLFGRLNFRKGKVKTIRHEMTPNVGMNFSPDYTTNSWGYYRSYLKPKTNSTSTYDTIKYTIFDNSLYGTAGSGPQAALTFGISSNLQMKVSSKKDTTGSGQKVAIFDRLSLNSSYNFIADSLKLAPFTYNGSTTLFNKKLQINFNGSFDPYILDSLTGRKRNTFEWTANKRLMRFVDFSFSVPFSFSAQELKQKTERGSLQEREEVLNNPNQFINFNIPWSLNADYTFTVRKVRIQARDTLLIVQTLNFGGEINLTPKWRLSLNSGYDFVNKQLSRTTIDIYRDLHCWEMSFNIVPIGQYRNYSFSLRVKSTVLQDLKLQRRRSWLDTP
jgi:lipopolysaccharide assembly outer membrane protein LptD (OstA)